MYVYTHTHTHINAHKEQNSVNWTGKGLGRCQIIGYSRLSDSNSTDLSFYSYLFLLLLLHLGYTTKYRSIPFEYQLHLLNKGQ